MEEIAWVSGRYRPLAKGAFLNTLRELKTLIKEIQRINVYVQDDTIKVIDTVISLLQILPCSLKRLM